MFLNVFEAWSAVGEPRIRNVAFHMRTGRSIRFETIKEEKEKKKKKQNKFIKREAVEIFDLFCTKLSQLFTLFLLTICKIRFL